MTLNVPEAGMNAAPANFYEPPSPGELLRLAMLEAAKASTPREAALTLARHGIPVFPCDPTTDESYSKRPLTMPAYGFCPDLDPDGKIDPKTRRPKLVPNSGGYRKATTDEARVGGAWADREDALVGMPVAPGEVIVDLDVGHKGGEDGIQTLKALEAKYGEELRTFTTRTPKGGLHLRFTLPDGVDLPQDAGLLPGIDTRTAGKGYTVEFGTLKDGSSYAIHDESPVAEMPGWLVQELLNGYSRKRDKGKTPQRATSLLSASMPSTAQGMFRDGAREYVVDAQEYEAAFSYELDELRNATERNNQLNRTCFNIGQLVAEGGIDEEQAVDAIERVAREIGLEDAEIEKTIRSGLESGKKSPRIRARKGDGPAPKMPGMQNAYEALTEERLNLYVPNAGLYGGFPPPRDWLFSPMFESAEVGNASGPGGSGKSTMWTQGVFSVGTGTPFLEVWPVEGGPQKAWYLSGEDSQRTLHRRQRAIMDRLTPRQQALAQRNVRIIPLKGMAVLFKATREGVAVPAEGFGPFREALLRERPRLVVIDPFTSLTLIDEMNNTAITQCIRMLEPIAEEAGTTIIYLHHVSKRPSILGSFKEMDDNLTAAAVRGGGAIVNAPRWASLLYPLKQKFAATIVNSGTPITADGELVVFKEVKKNGGRLEPRRYFRHSPDHGLLLPCFDVREETVTGNDRIDQRRREKATELGKLARRLAEEAVRREQTQGEPRMSPAKATVHLGLSGNSDLSGDVVARAVDEKLVHVIPLKELRSRELSSSINSKGGGSRILPTLAALEMFGKPDADVYPGLRTFLSELAASDPELDVPCDPFGPVEDAPLSQPGDSEEAATGDEAE